MRRLKRAAKAPWNQAPGLPDTGTSDTQPIGFHTCLNKIGLPVQKYGFLPAPASTPDAANHFFA